MLQTSVQSSGWTLSCIHVYCNNQTRLLLLQVEIVLTPLACREISLLSG